MLKKKLIRFSSRRAIKNNVTSRKNTSFHSSKHIGIIFTWEGEKKAELIKGFLEDLDLSGKKLETICYFPSSLKNEMPPESFHTFNDKDFNYFGFINSQEIQEFVNTEFDFLIHLDTLSNVYIENILAKSKAKCRISRHDHSRQEYYDFMIQIADGEGLNQLCKEILHYTKSLVAYD